MREDRRSAIDDLQIGDSKKLFAQTDRELTDQTKSFLAKLTVLEQQHLQLRTVADHLE